MKILSIIGGIAAAFVVTVVFALYAAAQDAPSSPAQSATQPLALSAVTYRATETNDTWTRYSWQATLTNQTGQPLEVTVTAQFLDKDGFVLDEDRVYGVRIDAGQAQTVSDYQLVDASVAPQVTQMQMQVWQR